MPHNEQDTAGLPEPQTLPDMTGAQDAAQVRLEEETQFNPWLSVDAPLYPLGMLKRDIAFIDSKAQLIECDAKLTNIQLVMHCGTRDWLLDKFPKYGKPSGNQPPPLTGFDHAEAMQQLALACNRRGLFDGKDKVFGRGAHRAKDDSECLVLHAGTKLFLANSADQRGRIRKKPKILSAGPYGDAFYPAQPALPPPATDMATDDEMQKLHDDWGEWNWKEPAAAKILLTGMAGQMMICGVFDWRAHIWFTGGTGCGKSTLQQLLRLIGGRWVLSSEDATEAWVRNTLHTDRLAVMLDEAETEDGPERQAAMINLARKGSSGATMGRATKEQGTKDFEVRSCFIMSSIIHGIHMGQDRNRFAMLDLLPLEKTKEALIFDEPYLRQLGAKIQRRMMDMWPLFKPLYVAWQKEIQGAGFSSRWASTFGTLLTCADLLMHGGDHVMDNGRPWAAENLGWLDIVRPLMERGSDEAQTDSERCIAYLTSTHLPGAGGSPPEPVGRWIRRVIMGVAAEGGMPAKNKAAIDKLAAYGLRVGTIHKKDKKDPSEADKWGYADPILDDFTDNYLLVAGAGMRSLAELFRSSSEWAKAGWTQSLSKLDGAERVEKVKFDGQGCAALAIPMKHVLEGASD